jgi:hypothetical protein
MSHANGQNGQRTLQPLRGKRPPNVEGRMRRRHLIDALNRWEAEDENDGKAERESWNELERTLRR